MNFRGLATGCVVVGMAFWLIFGIHVAAASPAANALATVTSPGQSAEFDWDSPQTWAELSESLGIVGAGLTLFVGWRVRKSKRESELRRQLQEWALRAVAVADAIERELTSSSNNAADSPQAVTRRLSERLDSLSQQVSAAHDAFLTLQDPGDETARFQVISSLQVMIELTSRLADESRWILSLRERLSSAPGDKGASDSLGTAHALTESLKADVLRGIPEFRRAVGRWLEQTGALSDVRKLAIFERLGDAA